MAAKIHTRNSYQSVIIKNNPTKFKNGRQKLTKLLQTLLLLEKSQFPSSIIIELSY